MLLGPDAPSAHLLEAGASPLEMCSPTNMSYQKRIVRKGENQIILWSFIGLLPQAAPEPDAELAAATGVLCLTEREASVAPLHVLCCCTHVCEVIRGMSPIVTVFR